MRRSTCENCGIVIRWQPTIIGDHVYCCLGCAQGGPCECDYDNLPRPDEDKALVVRPARELARPIESGCQVRVSVRSGNSDDNGI